MPWPDDRGSWWCNSYGDVSHARHGKYTQHFYFTVIFWKPAIVSPSSPQASHVLLLSPWDISSGRTRISPPKTSKGGGRFRGRVDGNVKTVNYLQKRVRARARASRHKRGFHLSRHFHHTADPIREYTREERVTRELVAGMVGQWRRVSV